MYELEIILFIAAIVLFCYYIYKWYNRMFGIWEPRQLRLNNWLFGLLPLVCFVIIYITLRELASFDVVNSAFYISFYMLLGFIWVFFGEKVLFYAFDLSLIDDVYNNRNKAASFSIFGGFIGMTLIYAGANIGDGPGFWCVFIAGGIGLLLWIILIKIVNRYTNVIETVTMTRDLGCGIRFSSFMIASGIIIARASGGDWTSFIQTIIEFQDGWPVLILTAFYILIEKYYYNKAKNEPSNALTGSIISAIWLIVLAILALIYIIPPFNENPQYNVYIYLIEAIK